MPNTLRVEPLAYETKLESRSLDRIDLVVIHCTELPELADARAYGEKVLYDAGTGNSGHYYIDRDGRGVVYVRPDRIAHHVRGYNPRAVGIELVNVGRYPNWLGSRHQGMHEAYPAPQIEALVSLLHRLQNTLPALHFIAGHEDLDREQIEATDNPLVRVSRKCDPGPLFPWEEVMAQVNLQRLLP